MQLIPLHLRLIVLNKYSEYSKKSEIYYAYSHVYRLIEDPYHNIIYGALINETIFNASRFLVNSIGNMSLPGVNKVYIYYALSLLGTRFEAYRTARFGYEKLHTLKIAPEWQEEIDIASLKLRWKPFSDKEGYQPVCNRWMNVNPRINQSGDHWTACGHPFIRNFIGFDTLPLVEFIPDRRLNQKQVIELLKEDPEQHSDLDSKPKGMKIKKEERDGWKENIFENEQTLAFHNNDMEDIDNDPFTQKMIEWLETQVAADSYNPVEVGEEILRSLRFSEIYIVDLTHIWKSYPLRFFRNVIPDISIGVWEHSGKFYLQEEFEYSNIEGNEWPFGKIDFKPANEQEYEEIQ